MIGLVGGDISVGLDRLAQRLVETVEKRLGLREQPVGGGLLHIEAILVEVFHDALYRHGVHIAQVRQTRDKRAIVVGIEERSVRGLALQHGVALRVLVHTVDDSHEPHRYELIAHDIPMGELSRR